MSEPTAQFRVLLLANLEKPAVVEALREFRPWLAERAKIVAELDACKTSREAVQALPAANLAIVLGGDGTLLAQGRHLMDRHIPMLGVNFGKLGFLAEFSLDDVRKHWDLIVTGRCRKTHRLMLHVIVFSDGKNSVPADPLDASAADFDSVALNDAVITAGPPYRMIEMELSMAPSGSSGAATSFSGDGVIVSTPSGSTAYNLSAGGPIISPGVDAICVTPLSPHTLAFRPLVLSADAILTLHVTKANAGTTLVLDGQESLPIGAGHSVHIRRHARSLILVHNPDLNYLKMLARKMRWAARPRSG